MWSYIKKEDADNLLVNNTELKDFKSQLFLLETQLYYFLPRYISKFIKNNNIVSYNGAKQIEPKSVDFNFTQTLKPKQIPAVNAFLKKFNLNKFVNGIGKMPPGFGKTVCAVYIASKLKLKTIVLIDNTSLLDQWVKAFINFTDLTVDDIGLIKQKTNTVDKPVVIAFCQSLLSKYKTDFNKIFNEIDNARFGLVIYDEVHCTSSSENFAKVSLLFRTKNILGLSATPFHKGISDILMRSTIGDIIYETDEYDLTPKYYFTFYNSGIALNPSGKVSKKKNTNISNWDAMNYIRDYIQQKSFYNKIIVSSKPYLEMIKTYTQNLYNSGYNILIIAMTIEQIHQISNVLTVPHIKFYGEQNKVDKENDRVLVATYSYSGKGFDMKSLSALILASPICGKKSLIQVIGRITRADTNKKQPIVIDFIDEDFPILFSQEYNIKKKILKNEFSNIQLIDYKIPVKKDQET